MDLFDNLGFDDMLDASSYDMDSFYESSDSGIDSMMDNWQDSNVLNDFSAADLSQDNIANGISFKGHLEDLYNPDIHRAQENYDYHMTKLTDSDNVADMKYHLEEARHSRDTELFFQDCLEEARRNQAIEEARLDSITEPAEIAKRYQQEIEDIYKK